LSFLTTAVDCQNYSLTLKGWAENNPTVTNRTIGGDGRTYGPAAVAYRNQLISQGWNILNDTYNASCAVTLPVEFGDITAAVKNGRLMVDWTTLSETNNVYFVIEASPDGVEFVSIGELKTQAKEGNAEEALSYSFTKDASAATGLLGIAIATLALSGFIAGNKRKAIQICLVAGMLLFAAAACNKNDKAIKDDTAIDLYIRIKQVDKDGAFKYSKVVKVVKR